MALKFKENSPLREDLGSAMRHQGPQRGRVGSEATRQAGVGTDQGISQRNLQGVDLFRFNFQSWQQNVIRALERDNNIYVVASPGAGKTAPVAYWWADYILHVNPGMRQPNIQTVRTLMEQIVRVIRGPENIPKILYLCPVRQLVYNIQREFREYFSQIFMHALQVIQTGLAESPDRNARQNIMDTLGNIIQELERNSNNQRTQIGPVLQQRRRTHDEYENQVDRNPDRANNLAREIQNLDNEIFNRMGELIRTFIDRHLLHARTAVDQPPRINHSPLVTVAIYESGRDIFRTLSRDDLRAVIIDEAHLIQEREGNSNDRAEQITNNIYPIIRRTGGIEGCRLILLSGTVNPTSATNLCNFFRHCFNIQVEQVRGNTRNPSDVSVLPMDELNKEDKLVNILANPKEEGNVIILFSKKRIDQLTDKALEKTQGNKMTAQQIDRGDKQSPRSPTMNISSRDYDEQTAQQNPDFANNRIRDRINELPGAEDIRDEKLLRCVMAGFGYIYRQDDSKKSDAENRQLGQDQQIVADLFSQGKIKTIIATDSIGIGVNMKVKNMFVPSVSRPTGSGFENLPISDASQLFNRVGRMAYAVSNIYTPEANVDEILRAISASNEKYDERSTVIKNFNQSMCKYMAQNDNLWSAAMGVTRNAARRMTR